MKTNQTSWTRITNEICPYKTLSLPAPKDRNYLTVPVSLFHFWQLMKNKDGADRQTTT